MAKPDEQIPLNKTPAQFHYTLRTWINFCYFFFHKGACFCQDDVTHQPLHLKRSCTPESRLCLMSTGIYSHFCVHCVSRAHVMFFVFLCSPSSSSSCAWCVFFIALILHRPLNPHFYTKSRKKTNYETDFFFIIIITKLFLLLNSFPPEAPYGEFSKPFYITVPRTVVWQGAFLINN